MTAHLRINNAWKSIKQIKLRKDDVWKNITKGYIRVSGAWKLFFTLGSTIQQRVEIEQTQGMDYVITLVGYNYHWSSYDSAIYQFEKSINGESTWSQIDSGSISNPSSGTRNTKQYVVPLLTPNVANIYRFSVTVTSDGSQTESVSETTTVQATRDISNLQSTASTPTTISLSWTKSQYSNSQLLQYKQSNSLVWSNFNTYSGTAQSATVTGLTDGTQYNFRIRPFTGTSQQGYPGNFSNTATASTANKQLACYPKLTCDDDLIFTSVNQPSIGSTAGSACWVSSAITQYEYFTNTERIACDTPFSVSSLFSPCPGCSVYTVIVTVDNCNGTRINTNSSGAGCNGCPVDVRTDYFCSYRSTTSIVCGGPVLTAFNNVCPATGTGLGQFCNCVQATVLSCSSPRTASTCPTFNSGVLNGRCSACTSFTNYSCPSGYSTPFLQNGQYFCSNLSTPFNTIAATVTTGQSFTANENIQVKQYQTRVTQTIEDCNATPYVVSGPSASCPGCSLTTEVSRTCTPGSSSVTDYRCNSRTYYTCDNGPFYTNENPVTYSCSQNLISTYNFKKYVQSCDNFITFYASSTNDPICQGCPTSELP